MFALHGRHFAAEVLDFSNFNTENIVDMAYMFNGFYKCRSIDLNKLNTSNVVDMTGMFSDCTEMEYLNVKNFNTSKVHNYGNVNSGTGGNSNGSGGNNFGIQKCPHVRSGYWRTYKSGKKVYVKSCVVHKDKYRGYSSADQL